MVIHSLASFVTVPGVNLCAAARSISSSPLLNELRYTLAQVTPYTMPDSPPFVLGELTQQIRERVSSSLADRLEQDGPVGFLEMSASEELALIETLKDEEWLVSALSNLKDRFDELKGIELPFKLIVLGAEKRRAPNLMPILDREFRNGWGTAIYLGRRPPPAIKTGTHRIYFAEDPKDKSFSQETASETILPLDQQVNNEGPLSRVMMHARSVKGLGPNRRPLSHAVDIGFIGGSINIKKQQIGHFNWHLNRPLFTFLSDPQLEHPLIEYGDATGLTLILAGAHLAYAKVEFFPIYNGTFSVTVFMIEEQRTASVRIYQCGLDKASRAERMVRRRKGEVVKVLLAQRMAQHRSRQWQGISLLGKVGARTRKAFEKQVRDIVGLVEDHFIDYFVKLENYPDRSLDRIAEERGKIFRKMFEEIHRKGLVSVQDRKTGEWYRYVQAFEAFEKTFGLTPIEMEIAIDLDP